MDFCVISPAGLISGASVLISGLISGVSDPLPGIETSEVFGFLMFISESLLKFFAASLAPPKSF